MDASNLPDYDTNRLEGRVGHSVSRRAVFGVGVVFLGILLVFAGRAFSLQVVSGSSYKQISQDNTLRQHIIFATRGVIYDRTGRQLAWNVPQPDATSSTSTVETFALRKYTSLPGLALLLGFITYPQHDAKGNWWRVVYSGVSGVEASFNALLNGVNGSSMYEANARGGIERRDIVAPPQNGTNLRLSIDAKVQSQLYDALVKGASVDGFIGGAGVIMNVRTGELLALTSFPEYDHQAFQDGDAPVIAAAAHNTHSPMLDRAIGGLYTPGSIVKPMFAVGALNSGIISPNKIIVSTGRLIVPNPFDPTHPSIFNDWTVHGPIDMETAIAVSSDEYFYTIGGGYGDQKGLGIGGLDKYARIFGLASTTGIQLAGEHAGIIPTPAWKAATFSSDPTWRIGDTYHTAIGQFGFQITPIEAVRYAAALANDGKLLTPHLLASSTPESTQIPIPASDFAVARAGMRLAVMSSRRDATVNEFQIPGIDLAAKTGTAQLGLHNQWVNSWVIGFWPANDPKYAFAIVLEKGPSTETHNAAMSAAPFFQWLVANEPQYVN